MLRELHISNLALIEDVTIELGEGLNCFTGQTGAGKSLILSAFEILLGLRTGGAGEMLRPGAQEARITGVFELHDPPIRQQAATLLDQTFDAGDALLVTRKFYASGRSSLSVNGQPAAAAMVRTLGELLVDIHGQHDHQFLLKPANQLLILDAFGRAEDVRQRFSSLHSQWRENVRRREDLIASRSLRRQQLELYEFQAQEIDAADLAAGEFDRLKARRQLLTNLEKVRREAGQAYNALHEAEGSIVERLQMVAHVLAGLAELDPALAALAEQVRTCALNLQESAYELGRYTDKVDLDPRELVDVDDRLTTLNRLISKYASAQARAPGAGLAPVPAPGTGEDDPVLELLNYRQTIGRRIEQLRGQNEDLDQLEGNIAATRREMESVGKQLGQMRSIAAAKLKPLVEAQLHELGMAEAEFAVAFEPVSGGSDGSGGEDAGRTTGFETVEMLVRTNPGQPARPLRKIASGGELSRIMLAIKSILAQSDRISVLVFDEIDANVGGRMGTVIGQKLRQLAGGDVESSKSRAAKRAGHQVLCITHLPQIAAFADRHLRIAKSMTGKGKDRHTSITVNVLEGQARVEELAEMLAGKEVTATTRKQVREMLDTAAA